MNATAQQITSLYATRRERAIASVVTAKVREIDHALYLLCDEQKWQTERVAEYMRFRVFDGTAPTFEDEMFRVDVLIALMEHYKAQGFEVPLPSLEQGCLDIAF